MKKDVNSFLNYLEVEKGFSRHTVVAYRNDLYQLGDFMSAHGQPAASSSWSAVNHSRLLDYVLHLKDRDYAPTTVARKVAAARSFFRFLVEEGSLSSEPTENLGSPKVGKSLPRPIAVQEVHNLLAQPAKLSTPEAKRDRAMLELLYATGMRVSELISLNLGDINLEAGWVRCFGKGSKERIVPIHQQAAQSVEEYVARSRPHLLRDREEALFLNRRGERLTRQGFWQILKGYARAANLSSDVTPHTLRHSFATHMLSGGADLRSVQELLGHANISTTQVYTRLTSEHVRRVYDKSHPRAE
jgi:integrase/recombinase XerD